jgi:hypothetical protein
MPLVIDRLGTFVDNSVMDQSQRTLTAPSRDN